MYTKNCIYFLVGLFIFISCEKDKDKSVNDLQLQKFWKLSGYFNSSGDPINQPDFNPDTLFHYEVNVLFLWNENTQMYEIQGQGPYDLFWGEFTVNNKKLQSISLVTTGIKSEFDELTSYDNLFFSTLKNVTSYSIDNNKLTLTYGDESQYLLFDLKEEQYTSDKEVYLSAKIDGMIWQSNSDYTSAFVFFNEYSDEFKLEFGGTSDDTLANGFRYDVSFTINLPPSKGEFEFNNNGNTISSDGGISASCRGQKNQFNIDTRTTNGVIAITLINRSFIEGYFYFDAAGIGDDSGTNYSITDGKFLIQLNSESDWFKPFDIGG